jgi:hypothetical protein
MATYKLTQLQYSNDRKGPFQLYIYAINGRGYEVKTFFAREIEYPDEEIGIPAAKDLAYEAMAKGKEIRVTDGGDRLVFHAVAGKTIYGDGFFEEILL